MNTRLLDALACNNEGRPPVWLMRQAGRYMPEFRALRAKYDFMTLCSTPELAADVTMLPIDQLGVDGAILFSDILVVADALGCGVHFEKGIGPVLDKPVETAIDVKNLPQVSVDESLGYVSAAIRLLRERLEVPLIGFAGAPFTVASYMVEGGSSKDLRKTKQWLFRDPASFSALLDRVCDVTIDYLKMQVAAGAQALQVFDSWANTLAFPQFEQYSLRYLERIVEALRPTGVPVILFARGASVFAPSLASIDPACVSVDWNANLASLANQLPKGIAVQGNLDPDVLYAPHDVIVKEVRAALDAMAGHPGYIFNLGHGLKPDMDPEAVKTLVHTVQQYEPAVV